MKKIIIQGGNFYELFKIKSYRNVSMSAGTFIELLSASDVDITKIYMLKVKCTNENQLFVYNNPSYIAKSNDRYGTDYSLTFKCGTLNKPLLAKFVNTDDAVDFDLYEVKKYTEVSIYAGNTVAFDPINTNQVCLNQFPSISSGKKYHFKVRPLYSGNFAIYQNNTIVKDLTGVVSEQTYEFDITSAGTSFIYRTWTAGTSVWISINEVEETT